MAYRKLKEKDIWFILSPGRTGGVLLQTFIKNAYEYYGIPFKMFAYYKLKDIDASQRKKIEPGTAYHTHSIEDLKLIDGKAIKILSVRKPVESALSQCVSLHTNIWHYYPRHSEQEKKIAPFELDFDKFLLEYKRLKDFYKNIKSQITKDTIIIDYDSFKQDTNNLFGILNIKPFNFSNTIDPGNKSFRMPPLKTEGTPKEWFTNWSNIHHLINDLDNSTI